MNGIAAFAAAVACFICATILCLLSEDETPAAAEAPAPEAAAAVVAAEEQPTAAVAAPAAAAAPARELGPGQVQETVEVPDEFVGECCAHTCGAVCAHATLIYFIPFQK